MLTNTEDLNKSAGKHMDDIYHDMQIDCRVASECVL